VPLLRAASALNPGDIQLVQSHASALSGTKQHGAAAEVLEGFLAYISKAGSAEKRRKGLGGGDVAALLGRLAVVKMNQGELKEAGKLLKQARCCVRACSAVRTVLLLVTDRRRVYVPAPKTRRIRPCAGSCRCSEPWVAEPSSAQIHSEGVHT
jgi:hypothetical protein